MAGRVAGLFWLRPTRPGAGIPASLQVSRPHHRGVGNHAIETGIRITRGGISRGRETEWHGGLGDPTGGLAPCQGRPLAISSRDWPPGPEAARRRRAGTHPRPGPLPPVRERGNNLGSRVGAPEGHYITTPLKLTCRRPFEAGPACDRASSMTSLRAPRQGLCTRIVLLPRPLMQEAGKV